MKPILSRSGPNIELNALFIQPTRWCGLNCKGCYVKDHVGGEDSFHTSWSEQYRLFRQFYWGPHWANQITISVDDLHADPEKSRHMLMLIDSILQDLTNDRRPKHDRPEVHMTMHTPDTWWQYKNERIEGWHKLSMVSFSELPLKKFEAAICIDWFLENKVPVNWNKLVPKEFEPHKEQQKLSILSEIADHIYLVMYKSPVQSRQELPVDRHYMAQYQLYISQVVDKLPGDVRRKLTIDGCLSDTIKHSRTGFGCSSNVSRFQVWPDGSVSGCPYAFSGGPEIGRTAESIVENIRASRDKYDFKEICHLPSTYASLKSGSLRVIQ